MVSFMFHVEHKITRIETEYIVTGRLCFVLMFHVEHEYRYQPVACNTYIKKYQFIT